MRATKDSGVDWLGEIPADWDVLPARALFRNPSEPSKPDDIHLTPSQKYGVLPQNEYMEISGSRVVLNLSGSEQMRHVEAGDFISHLRSFQGGLEYSPFEGKVSNAYTVLRPRRPLVAGYFKHLFKSTMYVQGLQTTTDQLRDGQSVRFKQLSLLALPEPPLEAQRRIADFLDRETAKIDDLIAKQEELVATLDERRGAVISRAVTRWLVEGRPIRDSGVEWLGRVPADWDVKPLKSLCSITNSGVWGEEPEESLTGTSMPVATTAQITRDGAFLHNEMQVRSLSPLELKVGSVSKGDIVVVKSSGSADNIISGKAGYVRDTDRFCFGNFLMRLRVKAPNDSRFLFYFLISNLTRQRIERMVSTTTYPNLKVGEYTSALIPVPSPKEQKIIADYLDRETGEILESTVQANRIKDLLRERRQALISAAVTGKLEVGV